MDAVRSSKKMNKTFRNTLTCIVLIGGWVTLSNCSNNRVTPLLELVPSHITGIDFTNQLYEDEDLNIITF